VCHLLTSYDALSYRLTILVKRKSITVQIDPRASSGWSLQDFHRVGTYKLQGCQPYTPATFTPHGRLLVLIYIRVWVDPGAIVWAGWLSQWKTPPDIEPANLHLVAQCLSHHHGYLSIVSVVCLSGHHHHPLSLTTHFDRARQFSGNTAHLYVGGAGFDWGVSWL
jgi:hypothetical protein